MLVDHVNVTAQFRAAPKIVRRGPPAPFKWNESSSFEFDRYIENGGADSPIYSYSRRKTFSLYPLRYPRTPTHFKPGGNVVWAVGQITISSDGGFE